MALFSNLSERLNHIFSKLTKRGKLTELEIKEAMREVRIALLEADVNYMVAKNFINNVSAKALGEDVMKSLTPGQMVIKIVKDELTALMSSTNQKLQLSYNPSIIMMCGLQGAGKTTMCGKLGAYLKKSGKKPLLVACDIYRPAAINQLQVVGKQANCEVFERGTQNPVKTVKQAIEHAKKQGFDIVIIDTAGMRRKRAIEDESVEQYSVIRSLNAVRRADVCLIVMDANEGLSEQDVKIAGFIHDEGKPSVVVINKWDLVEKDTYTVEKFKKQLSTDLAFMDYFKYITLSALTGQRVGKLMEMVDYVYEKSNFRATTGLLNDVVTDAVRAVEPPSSKGRRAKIKYVTQPTTQPPTFVFFVSDAKLLHFSYRRYLENCIRRSFQLDGTPVKLVFRDDSDKE